MNITIREATKNDMSRVLDLIKELAEFEKEPNAVEVTTSDLEIKGFGAHPAFKCFVAQVDNNVEGIALVYPRYSTWKGVILHLEDLIVSQKMRGAGIGTALLDQVVIYGNEQGVKRISWEVLDWNENAITFYQQKGANVMRDWDVVQLDEKGIKNYISNIN